MQHINIWCPGPQHAGQPKRELSDVLRARVAWSAWASAEGDEDALIRNHKSGPNCSSPELRAEDIEAYRRGVRCISQSRLREIAVLHPSLQSVFDWPFQVLSTREFTHRQLDDWSARFRSKEIGWDSVRDWYATGGPEGFFAVALAYRRFGLLRQTDDQWHAAHYLFKAMPALCRVPFVMPHTALVYTLLKVQLWLLPRSCLPVVPDWQELGRQITSPHHDQSQAQRDEFSEPGTEFVEPPDPFIPYSFRRRNRGNALTFTIPDSTGLDASDPNWESFGIPKFSIG